MTEFNLATAPYGKFNWTGKPTAIQYAKASTGNAHFVVSFTGKTHTGEDFSKDKGLFFTEKTIDRTLEALEVLGIELNLDGDLDAQLITLTSGAVTLPDKEVRLAVEILDKEQYDENRNPKVGPDGKVLVTKTLEIAFINRPGGFNVVQMTTADANALSGLIKAAAARKKLTGGAPAPLANTMNGANGAARSVAPPVAQVQVDDDIPF